MAHLLKTVEYEVAITICKSYDTLKYWGLDADTN